MSTNEFNSGTFESTFSESKQSKILTNSGKILIALTGGAALGLSIICYPFVAPALRKHCLPYVPATTKQIQNALSSVRVVGAQSKLLDIGSGDGRIVIAAAKALNIESHGVELNYWLILYSRLAAFREGVFRRTKFFRNDLWKFNISRYDNIVVFGVEQMMSDLELKIQTEAQPDSTIIACRFPFPTLKPVNIINDGIDTVWVYKGLK
ncbi:ATP synthase subunit C lysine N-methyltransferase [Malaya genurostris]|uniref:ATP synthase subunit C lysine N-methyltransferase n=1 Tax=Malaya genurostris TaxID=325434 RepID=UPI0026F3F9FC|nr:ATP synthase subunit C lysine N-methyltransferase [Malaya genurostris]